MAVNKAGTNQSQKQSTVAAKAIIVNGEMTQKEKQSRAELAFEFIAKYNDGTELHQYNDKTGLACHFGHIAQDKVVELVLVSKFKPRTEISVNLITGFFYINGKVVMIKDKQGNTIPLGLSIEKRSVTSSWGNKAKLIYTRHVRRDFNMGTGVMTATIMYELGWEADVDDKHEKRTIVVDNHGRLAIPKNDNAGFKSL